jgi:hypothetical protein
MDFYQKSHQSTIRPAVGGAKQPLTASREPELEEAISTLMSAILKHRRTRRPRLGKDELPGTRDGGI